MRAIRVHEFGEPEVLALEEVPQPTPVEGEVLVRIQAAGVNPFETVREGGLLHGAARPPLHAGLRRRRRARRTAASVSTSPTRSAAPTRSTPCVGRPTSGPCRRASPTPRVRPSACRTSRRTGPSCSVQCPEPARTSSSTAPAAAWASRRCNSPWPPASTWWAPPAARPAASWSQRRARFMCSTTATPGTRTPRSSSPAAAASTSSLSSGRT